MKVVRIPILQDFKSRRIDTENVNTYHQKRFSRWYLSTFSDAFPIFVKHYGLCSQTISSVVTNRKRSGSKTELVLKLWGCVPTISTFELEFRFVYQMKSKTWLVETAEKKSLKHQSKICKTSMLTTSFDKFIQQFWDDYIAGSGRSSVLYVYKLPANTKCL